MKLFWPMLFFSLLSACVVGSDEGDAAITKRNALRFLLAHIQEHESWRYDEKTDSLAFHILSCGERNLWHFLQSSEIDLDSFMSKEVQKKWSCYVDSIYEIGLQYDSLPLTAGMERCDYKSPKDSWPYDWVAHTSALQSVSPFLHNIPETDKYEYFIGYTCVPEYWTGGKINEFLSQSYTKYTKGIPSDSLGKILRRYDLVTKMLRQLMPIIGNEDYLSWYNYYFIRNSDCVVKANYYTLLLKANGYCAATEFISAYRYARGSHYYSSIRLPEGWVRYSPESDRDFNEEQKYLLHLHPMNIYRFTYSAQDNTPDRLKKSNEYVPSNLSTPFITDVTKELLRDVRELVLPFTIDAPVNVAYLASFNSGTTMGYQPVTWGEIDHEEKKANFSCVIPDRVYFPIYFNQYGKSHLFHPPFYLSAKGKIILLDTANQHTPILPVCYLHRKYPMKEQLIEKARTLTGARIYASNDSSFKDRRLLGTIGRDIIPYWQDVTLASNGNPYRYYRIEGEHGMLVDFLYCWILDGKTSRDIPQRIAPQLPVLYPEDTLLTNKEMMLGEIFFKVASDSACRMEFCMDRPIHLKHLRFMPINADNGIVIGQRYQLFIWDGNRWKPLGCEQTARFNYLPYRLQQGRLYWLRNLTEGTEEALFTIDASGYQIFF